LVNSKGWKIGKEKERGFSFLFFLGVSGVQANTGKSKTGRNVEYRLAREERQSTKGQGPLSLFKKRTQKQTNEVNGIEFKQFSLGGRDERKDYRPLLPGLEHIHFPSLSFSISLSMLSPCEISLPFTIPCSN